MRPRRRLTAPSRSALPPGVQAVVLLVLVGAGACTRVIEGLIPGECPAGSVDPACPSGWPTGINSDPWLVTHSEGLTVMHPRVMVLNFANAQSTDATTATARNRIAALAEGSRYHGYSDPTAPAFLQYELVKVVDLTDHPAPSGWINPSSSILPTAQTGEFDPLALFSPEFAPRYGFPDPAAPSRSLSLCELFEKGAVNEVWIQDGEAGVRRAPLYRERKQNYDAAGAKIASFEPCIGGGCLDSILCGVTVRLAHLDPARGPGCDLEVRGWGIEGMWGSLPAFKADALAFLNRDFDTRFGVRFPGWADICDQTATTACITYPTPTSATGRYPSAEPWTISPFNQGCGTTVFAPNSTFRGDLANRTPVQARCEHFGLGDATDGGVADGSDIYTTYTATTVATIEQSFPDCGGGWQIYWRQSIPGLGNHAKHPDGSPMKNWWPTLFF